MANPEGGLCLLSAVVSKETNDKNGYATPLEEHPGVEPGDVLQYCRNDFAVKFYCSI